MDCADFCHDCNFYWLLILQSSKKKIPLWMQKDAPLRRITSEFGISGGQISPDGNYLIYQDSRSDIKLKMLNTGDIKTLIHARGGGTLPNWSPDGTQIVFADGDSTNFEIIICSIIGNVIQRLRAKEGFIPFNPAWSPDGSKFAYIEKGDTINYLVITRTDGTIEKTFTNKNITEIFAWSPDSRKIALNILIKKNEINLTENRKCAIHIFDVERGILSKPLKGVTSYYVSWRSSGIAWSPDGRYLVYVGYDGANHELFSVPVNPRNVLATGSSVRITKLAGKGEPFWPTFTRDGKQLSFGIEGHNKNIYTLPIHIQSAEISGKPVAVAIDKSKNEEPCWAPDGKSVVFRSDKDGQWDLYNFDFKTKTTQRLTFSKLEEHYPQFSSDGQKVYFSADGAIWGLPVGGGTAQQLTANMKINRFAWLKDGKNFFASFRDTSRARMSFILIKTDLINSYHKEIAKGNRYLDFTLSPDGRKLAVSGLRFSPDSLLLEKMAIYYLENEVLRDLSMQTSWGTDIRISWTPDGNYIIHDRWIRIPNDWDFITVLISVKDGSIRRVKLDSRDLMSDSRESIHAGSIDPSGKWILLVQDVFASDIWVLGEKLNTSSE